MRPHVIAWEGDIDFSHAAEFKNAIVGALDDGHEQLVIDLTAVTHVDSAALGVLVGAVKRLQGRGRVSVVSSSPDLRRVLEVTGLDEVLALSATRAEAVARLAPVG